MQSISLVKRSLRFDSVQIYCNNINMLKFCTKLVKYLFKVIKNSSVIIIKHGLFLIITKSASLVIAYKYANICGYLYVFKFICKNSNMLKFLYKIS